MSTRVNKEPGLVSDFFLGESLVQPQLNRITRDDRTVQIEPKIMRVLVCLVERHEQVVTREELMEAVWGDVFVSEQVLSRSISELRKVLADDSKTQSIIETIPKTGYRLIAAVSFETGGKSEASADGATTIEFPRVAPSVTKSVQTWNGRGLIISGVLVAALAVFAAWGWLRSPSRAIAPMMRLTLDFSETIPPEMDMFQSFALAPDGSRIVYVAKHEGRYQLFSRSLEQTDSAPLPGTEGGTGPFFSPDGQWIGFYAGGALKKVQLSGGSPVVIGQANDALGASWGEDGKIIYARRFLEGLSRVSAEGGSRESLTQLGEGEQSHFWPQILPGGKAVIFTAWYGSGVDEAQIDVLRLETGERRTLVKGGSRARYLSTGHLVYARKSTLRVAPFDLDQLEVTGPAAMLPERIATSVISGAAHYDCSRDGLLVYLPERARREDNHVLWVDRHGQTSPVIDKRQTYWTPRLSPNGNRLALAIQNENFDIWIYEIAGGAFKRLTFGSGNFAPVWTPDSRRIVFSSDAGGPPLNLYWKAANGSDTAERLSESSNLQIPGSWSPDGRALAYSEMASDTRWDIWLLEFDQGKRSARPVINTDANEVHPMFSPDGRWLAYTSDGSGSRQVYVQSFPTGGGKWQISTDGGTEPVWSRNGRELFYRAGDRVMRVTIDASRGFKASKPQPLFEGKYKLESATLLSSYDLAPDGRRFLMMRSEQQTAPTRLNVVSGWFEDMKHRLPTESR